MLNDESYMPIGKYGIHGEHLRMKDVPPKYLLWYWDKHIWNSNDPKHAEVKSYIRNNYTAIIYKAPDYTPQNPPMD